MFQRVLFFSILILSTGSHVNGQVADTLVPTGYSMPVPVGVAPGQILNLFVRGIGVGRIAIANYIGGRLGNNR
jgi:hypothetical protein